MSSFIRNPKDFWSGAIFISLGLATVLISNDYSMGSAGHMGPGYFPRILGSLLALLGAVGVLRSFLKPGEAVGAFAIKGMLLVIAGTLIFAFIVRGAGIVPAVVVLVLLGAVASIKFKAVPSILLSAGLAAFSTLVFVKALGLPMPILGPWFGF